jgi:hypothetical protein
VGPDFHPDKDPGEQTAQARRAGPNAPATTFTKPPPARRRFLRFGAEEVQRLDLLEGVLVKRVLGQAGHPLAVLFHHVGQLIRLDRRGEKAVVGLHVGGVAVDQSPEFLKRALVHGLETGLIGLGAVGLGESEAEPPVLGGLL